MASPYFGPAQYTATHGHFHADWTLSQWQGAQGFSPTGQAVPRRRSAWQAEPLGRAITMPIVKQSGPTLGMPVTERQDLPGTGSARITTPQSGPDFTALYRGGGTGIRAGAENRISDKSRKRNRDPTQLSRSCLLYSRSSRVFTKIGV